MSVIVRLDYEMSEGFEVRVGMHQGCEKLTFLFAVGVVIEIAREGVLSKLIYADDVVLMSETIGGL